MFLSRIYRAIAKTERYSGQLGRGNSNLQHYFAKGDITEAFRYLSRMTEKNIVTYTIALQWCTWNRKISQGLEILSEMHSQSVKFDDKFETLLLEFYTLYPGPDKMLAMFEKRKNEWKWDTAKARVILKKLFENPEEGLKFYEANLDLFVLDHQLLAVMFHGIVSSMPNSIEMCSALLLASGLEANDELRNLLIKGYLKRKDEVNALRIFEDIVEYSVTSFVELFSYYSAIMDLEKSTKLLSLMREKGIVPSERIKTSLIYLYRRRDKYDLFYQIYQTIKFDNHSNIEIVRQCLKSLAFFRKWRDFGILILKFQDGYQSMQKFYEVIFKIFSRMTPNQIGRVEKTGSLGPEFFNPFLNRYILDNGIKKGIFVYERHLSRIMKSNDATFVILMKGFIASQNYKGAIEFYQKIPIESQSSEQILALLVRSYQKVSDTVSVNSLRERFRHLELFRQITPVKDQKDQQKEREMK